MPAAGIVTLVAVGLLVAALAFYLLHVLVLLRRTSFTLGTIVAGLRAIAFQTRPVGEIVTGINDDLGEVEEALESILGTELTGEYTGRVHDEVTDAYGQGERDERVGSP